MEDTTKVYYIFDVLCGWCYGFSPVIKKLYNQYQDNINFEVLSGGMILHERVGPVGAVAPYIKDAFQKVELTTGVAFGKPYLEDLLGEGAMVMDSWPGSLALSIFKSYFPEKAILFASDLQHAIYFNGIEPRNMEHFAELAEAYGIDKSAFMEKSNDQIIHYATKQDFQISNDMQATGYPTVIVQKNKQYFLIARGYTDYDTLNERLIKVLSEE